MPTLFISTKHVQKLNNICASAAQRKLAAIRNHYHIEKYKPVTILEYCQYNRLDLELVMKVLEGKEGR